MDSPVTYADKDEGELQWISPISRLPNELLIMILAYVQPEIGTIAIPGNGYKWEELERRSDEDHHFRFTMFQVCSRFQRIINSSPQFWTNINLCIPHNCRTSADYRGIDRWRYIDTTIQLRRSKNRLLSGRFAVELCGSSVLEDEIDPILSRCYQILLHFARSSESRAIDTLNWLNTPLPNLRNLQLFGVNMASYRTQYSPTLSAPNLQHLEIKKSTILLRIAQPSPPLLSLVLHGMEIPLCELFKLLRNFRKTLRTLWVESITLHDVAEVDPTSPIIVMEALEQLLADHVQFLSIQSILQGTETPVLRELIVNEPLMWGLQRGEIPDLPQWDFPALDAVSCCSVSNDDRALRSLLAKAPNLVKLQTSLSIKLLTEHVIFQTTQVPVYCPQLTHLVLHFVAPDEILAVAQARRFHSLRSITVIGPHKHHPEDEEQRSSWRDCIRLVKEMPEIEINFVAQGFSCGHSYLERYMDRREDSNLHFPWWLG